MSPDTSCNSLLEIPPGWDCVPLDQLVVAARGISYGIVQPGTHDPGGVPIVRVTDVRNGKVDTNDVLRVAQDIESAYERTRLRGGEVLLSLVGTLGECAIAPERLRGWNVARAIGVIPIAPGTDPRWISLCLRSSPVQALMRAWATTTVQATLNLREVRRLPILLPSEGLRARITETLGALEEKIEQNQQTARALERLAQAIFRAWFVDFEPVKAKAAGATKFPSMPQPVFDALPTRFVNSDIGPVPDWWEVKALSSICTLVSGGTPKRSDATYWDGDVPWFSVRDAPDQGELWVIRTSEQISADGLTGSAARVVPKGSTIISARGTVGKLAMAGVPMAFNQSCYGLLPGDGKSFGYLHLLMQSVVAELKQRTHGSVFDTITRATFDGLFVTSPPAEIMSTLESVVEPLLALLLALVDESSKLAAMREYLLPKLLSGDVHVEATHG